MRSSFRIVARAATAGVLSLCLSGCITARMQDNRESVTGIAEGEGVVIMARSYHLGNETEADYITCVEDALARGSEGLRVIPHREFVDSLFPWFEPRTAPAETKGLPKLMSRPGVAAQSACPVSKYPAAQVPMRSSISAGQSASGR